MELRRHAVRWCVALIAVVATGCFERNLSPVNPCTRSRSGNNIRVTSVDKVDLLFMIDNSNSMSQEQESLRVELPRLVRVLTSGDADGDGEEDFQPVRSLHIGVITSDLGVGEDYVVRDCEGNGDDGRLLRMANGGASCSGEYPAVFQFQSGVDDPATFAAHVGCVAVAGTGGCAFEQQLEAVLKALSPSTPQPWTIPDYVPPMFRGGTRGHADGANAGFVREDSVLAIIMVTDEEDCSVADPRLFDPAVNNAVYPGSLNLRCFDHPQARHPIERYVFGEDGKSGLLGLRRDPNLLVFAGIVGVPVDSVPNPREIDYAAILAHEDMQERPDPDPRRAERLIPSCNVVDRGEAFPPRRIVQVAQRIEAARGSATIQSICQESFTDALDAILGKITDVLGGACLPRELNSDAQGFVQCRVFEVLPPAMLCDGLPGREARGSVQSNDVVRERCEVTQVGPEGARSGMQGWWYETAANAPSGSTLARSCPEDRRRIAFAGIEPITNSEIRLECLQTIAQSSHEAVGIGTFCDPVASADVCVTGRSPNETAPLSCDAAERTCAVSCANPEAPTLPGETTRCIAAGLLGDVCDTRTWLEAVGATEPGISEEERARRMAAIPAGMAAAPHNFCVNPTCI